MNQWIRRFLMLLTICLGLCLPQGNTFGAVTTADDIKLGTYICYTDSFGFTYDPAYRPIIRLEDSRRFNLIMNTGYSMETGTGTWSFIGEAEGSAPYLFLNVTSANWYDSRTYAFAPSVNGGLCKVDGYLGITPVDSEFLFEGSSGSQAGSRYGWQAENGNWYWYTGGQSYARNSWVQDNGVWYWLGDDGAMYANRWLYTGDSWYYLSESGGMVTGWVNLGGIWYYLSPTSGAMYKNMYTPDGYYVNASGVWVQNTSSGNSQNSTSSGNNQGSSSSKKKPGNWEPYWYNWEPTGYSAQDIDLPVLRAGKWVSTDERTVLYLNYDSSPDVMDYGIFYNGDGDTWENCYAEVNWDRRDSDGNAYQAKDRESGFSFSSPKAGVLDVTKNGETVRVFLERKKYDDHVSRGEIDDSSSNNNQGNSAKLDYDYGYTSDMLDYSYADRPWLNLTREGEFVFGEIRNSNGDRQYNSGTFTVSGNTLTLKITEMFPITKSGTPVVIFEIRTNGELELTYTDTGVTPVGTGFYVDTRE